MRPEPESEDDTDGPGSELREAFMMAFCHALHETRLSPMAVTMLAAEALGSIYREIADAHGFDDACPCGWQPDALADIEALQAALATSAQPSPVFDLRKAQVAGQA